MTPDRSEDNTRILDAQIDKTSMELPWPILRAGDVIAQRLRNDIGERTSRSELMRAVMLKGIKMKSAKIVQLLKDYRRARMSDIIPFIESTEITGPRRGRPKRK